MTELAGELLFEASGQSSPLARNTIKELAHHLGRLYGETIRACRQYEGLQDEVTTTFMCGMALEPNFGREEEVLRDAGPEAREDESKTPGQVLYEDQFPDTRRRFPWASQAVDIRLDWEAKARAAMEKVLDAPAGAPLPEDAPFSIIDWDKDKEVQEEAEAAKPETCAKCNGSGNMGFTMFVTCDAC